MTDPGDRSSSDVNTRTDMPDAAPQTVNKGIGEEKKDAVQHANEVEAGKVASVKSDPLDK